MQITTKKLLDNFKDLNKKTALTIVKLCNGTIAPDSFEGAQKRLKECYNAPSNTDLILNAVNDLIGGFGVEGTPYTDGAIYDEDFISYINFGDTYATTILYDPGQNKFIIDSWGNVYEDSPACAALNDDDSDDDDSGY